MCAEWALPLGFSVLGGLGKPGHSEFQAEGSPLGCLAAFSDLEERSLPGPRKCPTPPHLGQGRHRAGVSNAASCWVLERGRALICDPNLATGEVP